MGNELATPKDDNGHDSNTHNGAESIDGSSQVSSQNSRGHARMPSFLRGSNRHAPDGRRSGNNKFNQPLHVEHSSVGQQPQRQYLHGKSDSTSTTTIQHIQKKKSLENQNMKQQIQWKSNTRSKQESNDLHHATYAQHSHQTNAQYSRNEEGSQHRQHVSASLRKSATRVEKSVAQPVMYASEAQSFVSMKRGQSHPVQRTEEYMEVNIPMTKSHTTQVSTLNAHHQSHKKGDNMRYEKSANIYNDEDRWENAWEQDNTSSDEDDAGEDNNAMNTKLHQTSKASRVSSIRPIFRPTMDSAHSSSSPMKLPAQSMPLRDQNVASHMREMPISANAGDMEERGNNDEILTKQFDRVLEEGINGVQWDMSSVSTSKHGYDKPNISMFFPLLRVLGKGSFGKVVLVQKRTGQECGGLFAMKILRKSHLLRRGQIERTKTERKVLSIVDHPFIMKLHFAFQTDDKLFLVLDYCAGGELFFHLSRHRRFSEKYTRFYSAELLLALGHLHSRRIIYRDLKPENVLLDAEGHVKLGDFGLAKDHIEHPYKGAKSMCGTPEYMAPEILQQLGHGFCVDYWGLGMLTYEMMTGLPPWYTTDRQLLYRRLKSAPLDIPAYFSQNAKSLVFSLLQRNPRHRLGVRGPRQVMAHSFFRGLDFKYLMERRIEAPIRPCEGWKPPDQSDFHGSQGISSGKEMSILRIPSTDLDAATENFDKTFTRMPVASMSEQDDTNCSDDDDASEELNANTFVGFTFDEQKERDKNDSGNRNDTR